MELSMRASAAARPAAPRCCACMGVGGRLPILHAGRPQRAQLKHQQRRIAPVPHARPSEGLHGARRAGVVAAAAATAASPSPSASSPLGNPFLTVVLPTAVTLLLCNMDRICLSVAILPMAKEFGWAPSFQGVVQSAFLWGYMATQLLGGTLADRYGGKVVMAGGIFWFSLASMLLPLAATDFVAAAGLTVPAVLAARFMVGLGEGVALPTMNNMVAQFIPKESKARALGLAFSGFHGGNLLGLLLSPMLVLQFGWRSLFLIFGLLGAPLLAFWLKTVPDTRPGGAVANEAASLRAAAAAAAAVTAAATSASSTAAAAAASTSTSTSGSGAASAPSSSCSGSIGFRSGLGSLTFGRTPSQTSSSSSSSFSPASSLPLASQAAAAAAAAEASTAAAGAGAAKAEGSPLPPLPEVGVKELLSKSATWAIVIVNIVNHWGYFIYLNWMPSYFSVALGFDLRSSSLLSFLPWLVMACGSSLAGVLADSLVARGMSVTSVRKAVQSVAFLVPAVALMVLIQPGITPSVAVAAMTVALGTTSLGQAGFVANMSDIAPRHAGKMFGLCNTFGSLSGIVGVTAVGFIVDATRSFSPVFILTAGLYLLGTVAWNVLCTGEKVFD